VQAPALKALGAGFDNFLTDEGIHHLVESSSPDCAVPRECLGITWTSITLAGLCRVLSLALRMLHAIKILDTCEQDNEEEWHA
jgi:hypothetical protein